MFARIRSVAHPAALALVVVTAAACGSDSSSSTGPDTSTGSAYTLVGVKALANLGGGGSGVPVSFVDGGGRTLKFEGGSLKLEADGTFDLTVNVVFNDDSYDAGDLGTYSADGSTVSFSSTLDDGSYSAVISGSKLTTTYRVAGLKFELTFEAA